LLDHVERVAMAQQQIIWTALPNGMRQDGGSVTLSLSVFVAPRLVNWPTLDGSDFVDWPARLQTGGLTLDVFVDDGSQTGTWQGSARIVTSPPPDSQLWRALFTATTPVGAGTNNLAARPVEPHPAQQLVSQIGTAYTSVGTGSPDDNYKALHRPAERGVLKAAFGSLASGLASPAGAASPVMLRDLDRISTASEAELYRLRDYLVANLLRREAGLGQRQKVHAAELVAGVLSRTRPPGSLVEVIPTTDDPISAVKQFLAFHTCVTPADGLDLKSDASDGDYGFHQMLTALAEYPQLLRRLGLVIDLELTADAAFPLSSRGQLKQLRAVPSFGTALLGGTLIYSPATNYLFYPLRQPPEVPLPLFCAAPLSAGDNLLDAELSCGLLNLHRGRGAPQSDPVYDVMQLDVDGAMLKAVTTIAGIVAGEGHGPPPIDDSTETGAPSLRTSGLSITWKGHADALSQGLQRAAQHESDLASGVTTQMFAEDLIRGYRIDIRTAPPAPDQPGPGAASPWRSLHQRVGTYTVAQSGGSPIVLPDIADEGFVQPGFAQKPAATPGPSADPPPILVQDSLFHYQGWSLSVPRPSNPVDTAPGQDDPDPAGQTGAGGLQLQYDSQVPDNSLPRLRFGWYYQLRARAVDLAGNGLTLDQADQVIAAFQGAGISPPILFPNIGEFSYRRYEPLHAPELVLRQDLAEGETFETLVIRSNVGVSAQDFAASHPKYQAVNERHMAPPKTSQLMAEVHGVLDGSFGSAGDFTTYYNICKKEKGTFDDPVILDHRTGSYVPISYAGRLSFGSRSRVAGPDRYPIHGEPHLKLPYLPDPVISGAALFGLPGVLGQQGSIDPPTRQLEYTPSNLPGSAAAWLGYVTTIDYGPAQAWPDLSPFRLQLAEPPNDNDSPQAQIPPLPVWDDQERVLTVFLRKAETATIYLTSYPSPNALPFMAPFDWVNVAGAPMRQEDIVKLAQAGALSLISPAKKLTLVHAVQQPLLPPAPVGFDLVRSPGGTGAQIIGQSRVRWKSTAKLDLWATWVERDGVGNSELRTYNTHVYEIVIPTGDMSEDDLISISIAGKQEFNDTRYRHVQYQLVATSRFVEYFSSDIGPVTLATDPNSPDMRAEALNTVQPAAPKVSFMVPAFQWLTPPATGSDPVALTRRRIGGGLRVYLGPNWYLSGDGEKLAVVVGSGTGEPDAATLVGQDPIVTPDPSASATVGMLDVNGAPAQVINLQDSSIVAYDVEFEPTNGLWFADLRFDVRSANFNFVKLVLARYQPMTSQDVPALSLAVAAGITQVAPDRFVTLLATPPQDPTAPGAQIQLQIQVTALAGSSPDPARISVEVVLQEQTVAGSDDEFGWETTSRLPQPVQDQGPPTPPVLWAGRASVPASPPFGKYRLAVRELDSMGSAISPARMVFADTVPLEVISDAVS
jgi:hypothetical protein